MEKDVGEEVVQLKSNLTYNLPTAHPARGRRMIDVPYGSGRESFISFGMSFMRVASAGVWDTIIGIATHDTVEGCPRVKQGP